MLESILKNADSGHYLGEQMFQALIGFRSICAQYTLSKAFLPTQPPLDRLTKLFLLVRQVEDTDALEEGVGWKKPSMLISEVYDASSQVDDY